MTLRRIAATGLALAMAALVFSGSALAAGKAKPAGKVNINTASVEQLATLPGVGPKLAARIVEYRQKSGTFRSPQELMNVKGVGEKNFARIEPCSPWARPRRLGEVEVTEPGRSSMRAAPPSRSRHAHHGPFARRDAGRRRAILMTMAAVRCRSSVRCSPTRTCWRAGTRVLLELPARGVRGRSRQRLHGDPLRDAAPGRSVLRLPRRRPERRASRRHRARDATRVIAGPFPLATGHPRPRRASLPGRPPIPPERGVLSRRPDPLRQLGHAFVLAPRDARRPAPSTWRATGAQAAVRVTGGTARVRIMICRGGSWRER